MPVPRRRHGAGHAQGVDHLGEDAVGGQARRPLHRLEGEERLGAVGAALQGDDERAGLAVLADHRLEDGAAAIDVADVADAVRRLEQEGERLVGGRGQQDRVVAGDGHAHLRGRGWRRRGRGCRRRGWGVEHARLTGAAQHRVGLVEAHRGGGGRPTVGVGVRGADGPPVGGPHLGPAVAGRHPQHRARLGDLHAVDPVRRGRGTRPAAPGTGPGRGCRRTRGLRAWRAAACRRRPW